MLAPDQNQPSNRVEELLRDHRELVEYLESANSLLLRDRVESAFAKTLLIAAASYFEVRLTQMIIDLYLEMTQGVAELAEFVKRQAIGRRFAQLFQWGSDESPSRNANSFYILFGDGFSAHMKQRVQKDRDFDESVKAFLEIGNLRNQLVHGDYADFQLNKTVEDIYSLYTKAGRFVDEFPDGIRQLTGRQNPPQVVDVPRVTR